MSTLQLVAIPIVAAVLACAAARTAPAQDAPRPGKPEKVDPFADPFTKNDAEKLAKLGYVAIGRFLWLGDVTTDQVQQVLGDDFAIFLETEHFRIASTLRSLAWPRDKEHRDSLADELDRLAEVCPELKTRPRTITPWLRAHLYAQRLERLYADFVARLGIETDRFPKGRGGGARTPDYMGEGPYLGQPDKFLVVLTQKATSAGTYTRAFHGKAAADTVRHNHVDAGSLEVVTSAEFAEKALMDDRKLHCHVTFQVVHNLIDGYKFFWQPQPAWLTEGLPLWFSRRVDEEFLNFSGRDHAGSGVLRAHEWARRVRMRVENDAWPKAAELCTIADATKLDYAGHMMAWSRVDFLFAARPAEFGRFVAHMKAPMTTEARLPTTEEMLGRQVEALRGAFQWDYDAFDAEWVEYVRTRYPKK